MEYELYHWGVKGMKWGVRRYQRKDGTLTETGKKHISNDSDMLFYNYRRKERKLHNPITNRLKTRDDERLKQARDTYRKIAVQERDKLLKEQKTLQKAGYKFVKNPDSDTLEHNSDILSFVMHNSPTMKAAQKAYTKTEVDVFADALIADLNLKNTEKAKKFVTETLIKNNKLVRHNLGVDD